MDPRRSDAHRPSGGGGGGGGGGRRDGVRLRVSGRPHFTLSAIVRAHHRCRPSASVALRSLQAASVPLLLGIYLRFSDLLLSLSHMAPGFPEKLLERGRSLLSAFFAADVLRPRLRPPSGKHRNLCIAPPPDRPTDRLTNGQRTGRRAPQHAGQGGRKKTLLRLSCSRRGRCT